MSERRFDSIPHDFNTRLVWDSFLKKLANGTLGSMILGCYEEYFTPRFQTSYNHLMTLPRRTRRAIQRQLARAGGPNAITKGHAENQRSRVIRHKLAWSLAGAALLLALGQDSRAASIHVDTTKADVNDGDGKCSLAEAIVNANNNLATYSDCDAGSGTDYIDLPGGTHTISTPFSGYLGLPPITSTIVIEGQSPNVKIARKRSAAPFNLFTVTASGNLTLEDVTLTGGYGINGGAIYNQGSLTIERSTISGNRASFGGGIFNNGAYLKIEDGTVTKNTAVYGGGVFDNGAGTANFQRSTISRNKATYYGGGVQSYSTSLSIADSTITGNRVGDKFAAGAFGGGVFNAVGANLTIQNSTISKNTGTAFYFASGGGIANEGTVSVEDSTIEKNKAVYGAGLYNLGNAGVDQSTISQNLARPNKFFTASGGGIDSYNGVVSLNNSTISGNKADVGGGLSNANTNSYLSNVTITKNRGKFSGGGIYNLSSLDLDGTLISGNKTPASGAGPEAANYGSVTADNSNLFGANDNSGTVGVAVGASDIVPGTGIRSSKVLSPGLKLNGGPTKTHALITASPAIDVAPCLSANDQRGVGRPQGPGCDIGAFEGPP